MNDFKRMWTREEIEGMGGGVSEEQFEELVRATPTDVNIVKDQDKWQIQLEHDSNVLSITDMTPFVNEINNLINNKISVVVNDDNTIDLTIN